jgi:tRNA(Ile)-lysidine synthase
LVPFDKKKSSRDLNKLKLKIARKFALNPKEIKICFRQRGGKVKLPGRRGTHKLKKLMQEWGVPPWMRDRVPLVYCGDKIIAVDGYYGLNHGDT